MVSPVMPELPSDARNTPVAPTSLTSTLRLRGARSACVLSISLSPETPRAARVLIGPAEMAFTRILFGPRSLARYRTVHSSAAFATAITLYFGTTKIQRDDGREGGARMHGAISGERPGAEKDSGECHLCWAD